jgi:hypothetical protein
MTNLQQQVFNAIKGCSTDEERTFAAIQAVVMWWYKDGYLSVGNAMFSENNPPPTMEISHTLQRLSKELNNPEVLTNPEQFLGPNWETVLRWWLFEESLTYEQKDEMGRRYLASDIKTCKRAWNLARNAANEVIGKDNWAAVRGVSPYPQVITFELIALHKLENPFFLPLVVPELNYKQN